MRTIVFALGLAGCATSHPGSSADFRYYLPATNVTATLTINYEGCEETLDGPKLNFGQTVNFSSEATIDHSAQPHHLSPVYSVRGTDLQHWRQTRDLSISVNKIGVIKSINTTDSDKTASIITNSFEPINAVLNILPGHTISYASIIDCSTAVPEGLNDAFNASLRLQSLIQEKQSEISSLGMIGQTQNDEGSSLEELREEVNVLASELARIKLSYLSISTSEMLQLSTENPPAQPIPFNFPTEPFDLWEPNDSQRNLITSLTARELSVSKSTFGNPVRETEADRLCEPKIYVPRPDNFVLKLSQATPREEAFESELFELALDIKDASTVVPIAQWSQPGAVCLGLSFGESRTIKLSFDDFGRTTSFSWKSNARGEAVSGAIAGTLKGLEAISEELEGDTEMERQAAEITRLETEQKYNRLQECAAIIEAGGYDCDGGTQ